MRKRPKRLRCRLGTNSSGPKEPQLDGGPGPPRVRGNCEVVRQLKSTESLFCGVRKNDLTDRDACRSGGLTHMDPRNHVSWGQDWTNPFATARGNNTAMRPFVKILRPFIIIIVIIIIIIMKQPYTLESLIRTISLSTANESISQYYRPAYKYILRLQF